MIKVAKIQQSYQGRCRKNVDVSTSAINQLEVTTYLINPLTPDFLIPEISGIKLANHNEVSLF
jgi:hypothetical protein